MQFILPHPQYVLHNKKLENVNQLINMYLDDQINNKRKRALSCNRKEWKIKVSLRSDLMRTHLHSPTTLHNIQVFL